MEETCLPCIECISYAICISQEEIVCDILEESVNLIKDHEAGWKLLNEVLPKLEIIKNDLPLDRYGPRKIHYK